MTINRPLRPWRLSADGEIDVMSGRRHQRALAYASHATAMTAALVLSGRRVAVIASTPEPQEIGRLSEQDAARYMPVLRALRQRGCVGECFIRVSGNGRAQLLLGPAESAVLENSVAGLVMLQPEVTVTVTQEEHHQQALFRYGVSSDQRRRVAVELGWCTILSGKYRGQQAVEVRLDGHRVGQLTYAMSRRYATDVQRILGTGGRPGCEALVFHGARGIELELRLPRRSVSAIAPTAQHASVAPAQPSEPSRGGKSRRPLGVAAGVVALILFIGAVNRDNDESPPETDPADSLTTSAETTEPVEAEPVEEEPTTSARGVTKKPRPKPKQTTTQAPAPEPEPAPKPRDNCHPSYEPCVPVVSDVDCDGGSGNGPAYVQGPIRVVGPDVYDLDRNGDGVACEAG